MTRCQCVIPSGGWCPRHKVQKAKHFVKLCQNNEKYWQAWEEGRGPGQKIPDGAKEDVVPRGVGTILKKLLGCSCKLDYATINNWGPDECESRLEEIVSMTCTAHRKNGSISEDSARRLIRMAIERSRNELNSFTEETRNG